MAQGDLPTSRGGSLHRRKEKRQLEQLVQAAQRGGAVPKTATAHVRVIEDDSDAAPDDRADAAGKATERSEQGSPTDTASQGRTGGFHVRPVPIDQPVDQAVDE